MKAKTPTIKLLESLECDKDSSIEAFVIKHNQFFNNEVDMYGDIKEAGQSDLKVSFYFFFYLNILGS
jgi:hypothetical protein